MTDRLKLSELKFDAKADAASRQLMLDDAYQRIKELERNNAAIEALLAERAKVAQSKAPANKIGARKSAKFKAVSTAPSINKTPRGSVMVPVAYPTTQDLSNSVAVASTVRFNGDPVYLLDSSKQPGCKGDDQGTGGGIRSGTVNGEVKPVNGSSTVRVEGKYVVRQGDPCTMNGGNNPGIYTTVQTPSAAAPADAIATSNPPVTLDTPEEKTAFKKWLAKAEEELRAAIEHPLEGAKGAAKGVANAPSSLAELLLKSAAEQRASELDEAALVQSMFGSTGAGNTVTEVAQDTRENASKIELPKFTMNNPAQEGGDKISMALQLFAGGAGIVKGAVSWMSALAKGGEAAEVGTALPGVLSRGSAAKSGAAKAEPAGDGVKVVPRVISHGASSAAAADAASIRAHVLSNIADSQAARASSNFGQFVKNEGQLQESLGIWPPNSGGYSPILDVTLDVGTKLDRYGFPGGKFVSPQGASFGERALPSAYETTKPYFQYEVLKPIPGVTQAKILPWFGQPGMGTQFQLPQTVQWYLKNGYLGVVIK